MGLNERLAYEKTIDQSLHASEHRRLDQRGDSNRDPLDANVYFVGLEISYLVVSMSLGFWTARRLQEEWLRVVLRFSIGYVLGALLGPLGSVAGAIVGAYLAKRTLATPTTHHG